MSNLSVEEPLGGVRHLMNQGVDSLAAVPLEHQVDIKRDLDHCASTGTISRDHLSDPRLHPVAQANWHLARKPPVEPSPVQVPIESPQIEALLRRRTTRTDAIRRVPSSTRRCTPTWRPSEAVFATHATQLEREPFPAPHLRRRCTVRGRSLPCLPGDHGEVVHDLQRSRSIGDVEVEHRAPLGKGPDGATICAEANPPQAPSASSEEESEYLIFASCRHCCPP